MNNDVSWLLQKGKEVHYSEKPVKSIMALFIKHVDDSGSSTQDTSSKQDVDRINSFLGDRLNITTHINGNIQEVSFIRKSIHSPHWYTQSTYHEKMLFQIVKTFFEEYNLQIESYGCQVEFFLSIPNEFQFIHRMPKAKPSEVVIPLHE